MSLGACLGPGWSHIFISEPRKLRQASSIVRGRVMVVLGRLPLYQSRGLSEAASEVEALVLLFIYLFFAVWSWAGYSVSLGLSVFLLGNMESIHFFFIL